MLKSLNDDSEIEFYKKLIIGMNKITKNTLIEQFIINCLPFYKEILNKDINFFLKKEYTEIEGKKHLLNCLKIKKIFPTLTPDAQDLICEYIILLANYAKDYFNLKYKK